MITDALAHALIVERFGLVPDDELHAEPLPVIPWTPDTPRQRSARRRLLYASLLGVPGNNEGAA